MKIIKIKQNKSSCFGKNIKKGDVDCNASVQIGFRGGLFARGG